MNATSSITVPTQAGMLRSPAIIWCVSFACGILIDRLMSVPLPLSVGVAVVCLFMCWTASVQKSSVEASSGQTSHRIATLMALTLWVALGSARHHQSQHLIRPDDLSEIVNEPVGVRLLVKIVSPPDVRFTEADPLRSVQPRIDKTVCFVQAIGMRTAVDQPVSPVSGRLQMRISGHLRHAAVGDTVSVIGKLVRPGPPTNPGEWDYREWLARHDCRLMLTVKNPDVVQIARPLRWWDVASWWKRFLVFLRRESLTGLHRELSPRNAEVASAMLIGERGGLTEDDRTAFIRSGTMHLLAISGLHTGLLAGLLWIVGNLARMRRSTRALFVIGMLVAYTLLTDARPSVVRATLFIAILLAARTWWRNVSLPQVLALTAGLLLIWNPTLLFDAGAQLSFLAVIGLMVGAHRERQWRSRSKLRAERLQEMLNSYRPWRRLSNVRQVLFTSSVLMLGVWLWTAPMVASSFHLVSPIGLVLNVLLIPVIGILLAMADLLLLCVVACPPLAGVVAWPVEWAFDALLTVVDFSALFWLGHVDLPDVPIWWTLGYYLTLTVASLPLPFSASGLTADSSRHLLPRSLIVLFGWGLLGLVWSLPDLESRPLTMTVLNVGNGSAILIECPGGETILFDGGSIEDGVRVRNTIVNAMRARGILRLDAIVISHADLDHFNAIPDLTTQTPTGRVLTSPQLLKSDARTVRLLTERLSRRGIPLRTVSAGDRVTLTAGVALEILHPATDADYRTDNESSVVAKLSFRGRSILLTADIEESGMDDLVARHSVACDVLLCPHHGSTTANTAEFAAAAKPKHLIVSSGRGEQLDDLRGIYDERVRIWHTAREGAITVTIDDEGRVVVQRFLEAASE